jgi:hypothetical protein
MIPKILRNMLPYNMLKIEVGILVFSLKKTLVQFSEMNHRCLLLVSSELSQGIRIIALLQNSVGLI